MTRCIERSGQQAPNMLVSEEGAVQTVSESTTTNDLIEGLPSRVHDVYAKFAQETPEHPAFVEAGRPWSYRSSRTRSRPPPAICAKCRSGPATG